MRTERIKEIMEQLYSRTAWGVCLDVAELTRAKAEARAIIDEVDLALLVLEEFVKDRMASPESRDSDPNEHQD